MQSGDNAPVDMGAWRARLGVEGQVTVDDARNRIDAIEETLGQPMPYEGALGFRSNAGRW